MYRGNTILLIDVPVYGEQTELIPIFVAYFSHEVWSIKKVSVIYLLYCCCTIKFIPVPAV